MCLQSGVVRHKVTTHFGKLDKTRFQRHPIPVGIDDPEQLPGVLDYL